MQAKLDGKNNKQEQIKDLIGLIRSLQRAVKGLDETEDFFQGLINPHDIKERTRLDETALLSHAAMREIGTLFPEFAEFINIAENEDHYYISEDGLGRVEGIAQIQAKTRLDTQNLIVNNTPDQQPPEKASPSGQPPKKSFINKILRR